jgi:6-pyruvoyltetrahydropterin/6-carboxytetrahydropterin synthase
MYEISVERVFSAAHALILRGEREPVHGHDWQVTVVLAGDTLDADGLLCDFHAVERALDEVIAPFHNADLNATPPFDAVNPSAENVARFIADALADRLGDAATVSRVLVTEAPGCTATYRRSVTACTTARTE